MIAWRSDSMGCALRSETIIVFIHASAFKIKLHNVSTAVELQDTREVSHPVFTQDEIHEMLEHVYIDTAFIRHD